MPKEKSKPITVKEAASRAGQNNLANKGVEYFQRISAQSQAVRVKYLKKGLDLLGPDLKPNAYLKAGREFYRPDRRVKKGDGSMSASKASQLAHETIAKKYAGTDFFAERSSAGHAANRKKRRANRE